MTNFFNLIYQSLLIHAQKELIIWPRDGINYVFTGEELLQKINHYRNGIKESDLKAGQKVLPAIPASIDTLCALLAIQSLGMVPVSPPSNLNFVEFITFLKKNKIKALAFDKKKNIFEVLFLKILGILTISKEKISISFDGLPVEVLLSQEALISFSSGSTSKPKAVYRSHEVLINQHLAIKNIFPPFEGQVDFPLFANILLHNLIVGVKSVLPDINNLKVENLNPILILKQIKEFGINSMTGNVFYFTKLISILKDNPQFFPQVKAIGIGGSPVHERLIQTIKYFFNAADCYVIYGSSEAEPITVRCIDNSLQNPMNGFFVGKAIEEITIRIIGNQEIKTPQGIFKTGEIEIKGKHVVTTKSDWLKTGDFGYLTANNDLYLTGRKGNEKTNFKIQHYQIEHLLLQQNGIEKVAAISTQSGFIVYLEGNIAIQKVWEIICYNLPEGCIKSINFKKKIPTDSRHHSKIIYAKLN